MGNSLHALVNYIVYCDKDADVSEELEKVDEDQMFAINDNLKVLALSVQVTEHRVVLSLDFKGPFSSE